MFLLLSFYFETSSNYHVYIHVCPFQKHFPGLLNSCSPLCIELVDFILHLNVPAPTWPPGSGGWTGCRLHPLTSTTSRIHLPANPRLSQVEPSWLAWSGCWVTLAQKFSNYLRKSSLWSTSKPPLEHRSTGSPQGPGDICLSPRCKEPACDAQVPPWFAPLELATVSSILIRRHL